MREAIESQQKIDQQTKQTQVVASAIGRQEQESKKERKERNRKMKNI